MASRPPARSATAFLTAGIPGVAGLNRLDCAFGVKAPALPARITDKEPRIEEAAGVVDFGEGS